MCIICKKEYEIRDVELCLDCSDCQNITEFPNNIPELLDIFVICLAQCHYLRYLPDFTPFYNLLTLELTECEKISYIPDLSETKISNLYIRSCLQITTLPKLPKSLKNLDCGHCYNLLHVVRKDSYLNLSIFNCSYTPGFIFEDEEILKKMTIFYTYYCPWIELKDDRWELEPEYDSNIRKLKILQRSCRKFIFRKRLDRSIILRLN
jgi:hypothetical protein